MNILVLDTETTGLTGKDEVIELAYIVIDNDLTTLTSFNARYKPSIPINPHAQAVHGIEYKELLSCFPSSKIALEPIDYMIGHNISFDKRLLIQSNPALTEMLEKVKYIDTKVLAKLIEKENKDVKFLNHKLDVLIEHYFPENPFTTNRFHDALTDCKKVLLLLDAVRKAFPALNTVEKLYDFQQLTSKAKK